MRKAMLRGPWISLAFLLAGILCVAPCRGALLRSQAAFVKTSASSPADQEKEILCSYLGSLGFSREEAQHKLSYLSEAEIHQLVLSLDKMLPGAGEQTKKAAGVAVVLIIVLAVITGIYLFYNANK